MEIAGIIGFILVCLIMLIVYRLPGFVAIIALLGQIGLCFAAVSGYFPFLNSFTMTLPGIAGIILSIGMGVDANVITATRIKEEVNSGKTLDGAIQKGNANSFWAIFDGNITTIMVALILMMVFGPNHPVLDLWTVYDGFCLFLWLHVAGWQHRQLHHGRRCFPLDVEIHLRVQVLPQ